MGRTRHAERTAAAEQRQAQKKRREQEEKMMDNTDGSVKMLKSRLQMVSCAEKEASQSAKLKENKVKDNIVWFQQKEAREPVKKKLVYGKFETKSYVLPKSEIEGPAYNPFAMILRLEEHRIVKFAANIVYKNSIHYKNADEICYTVFKKLFVKVLISDDQGHELVKVLWTDDSNNYDPHKGFDNYKIGSYLIKTMDTLKPSSSAIPMIYKKVSTERLVKFVPDVVYLKFGEYQLNPMYTANDFVQIEPDQVLQGDEYGDDVNDLIFTFPLVSPFTSGLSSH